MITERTAIVPDRYGAREIAAYLPDNYALAGVTDTDWIVDGQDVAGWGLDSYVIPRLASGLIFATEVRAHPGHAAVLRGLCPHEGRGPGGRGRAASERHGAVVPPREAVLLSDPARRGWGEAAMKSKLGVLSMDQIARLSPEQVEALAGVRPRRDWPLTRNRPVPAAPPTYAGSAAWQLSAWRAATGRAHPQRVNGPWLPDDEAAMVLAARGKKRLSVPS